MQESLHNKFDELNYELNFPTPPRNKEASPTELEYFKE